MTQTRSATRRMLREDSAEYRKRDAVETRLNLRFAMGRLFVTSGALTLLRRLAKQGKPYSVQESEETSDPLALVLPYIGRHSASDWGDLTAEDLDANEDALVTGARLLSAYELPNKERLWIITEADRQSTTVLLPSEY